MLRLSFITPVALTLLLLLPLLWAFTLLTPRRLVSWRFWGSLTLRSIILAALVLAIAGVQLVRPVRNLTTVFLMDVSDSITPVQRDRELTYVADALRDLPDGDQAAIVAFGEQALVERVPSEMSSLSRLTSTPITTRTNLQDAIQLGLALLPADTQQRLVLLSDGGENSGDVSEALRLAQARQVPIDVVTLIGERNADVILQSLQAPSTAREGQEETLQIRLESNISTSGALQIFIDGQLSQELQVEIPSGNSELAIQIPAGEAGFRRIEARLQATGDTESKNNNAAAFTEVQGPPRILLIASDASRAANLRDALSAAGARPEVRAPDSVPATLVDLSDYAGIIVVDTPAREMPRALLEVLPEYAKQLGRGLAMVGGADSFGAGGYRRTQLEEALPVLLDPLDSSMTPDVALVMVIDRSGSMGMSGTPGGRSKLDLAKEAVYQASLGLTNQDQIGLVAFDFTANWILQLQQLPSALEIEQALSTFDANGGTDIRPGIELATQALNASNAKIKHVILLTDGIADSNYANLVEELHKADTTISTVAVGDDANPLLEGIAEQGGGRFYAVSKVEDVPRIFLQETVIIAGRDIVEEPITPVRGLSSAAINQLGALPQIYGYNGTELRSAARGLLMTPDGKPLLAQWQYGLGRVVAWTSDLQGKWARDWVTWEQFPTFVNSLLDLMLPTQSSDQFSIQVDQQGSQATFDVIAVDGQNRPANNLTVQAQLMAPEGGGTALQFTQVAPGRYRATAQTGDPGVYLLQAAATDQQGQTIGTISSGMVVSYSQEYGPSRENAALLQTIASESGGRVDPLSANVFAPVEQNVGEVREIALPLLWLALLLWPLDIALRRLMLRRSDLVLPVKQRQPQPVSVDESLSRLSSAKQRARPERVRPTPTTSEILPTTARVESVAAPAAEGAKPRTAEAPAKPVETPANPSDEAFARLMAAKRRARERRDH